MATSRRCSVCGITYPPSVTECRVRNCGGRTDPLSGVAPDLQWESAVALCNAEDAAGGVGERRVIDWRLKNLLDAGYDVDTALELAERYRGPDAVDLHKACAQMKDLLERGCPPDIAKELVT